MTASPDPFAGSQVDWDAVAGRHPFRLDTDAVRKRVAGQAVLVTGAAGSLGRALSASLAAAGPRRLVLYDHHESSLFRIRQSLLASCPELSLGAVLGDVRMARRLKRTFDAERPSLVFHLAAYKHVPWGEDDPEAFVEANVLGARHVLRAAGGAGVEHIVYPSTDKAIDPPSLYGATKRLVEMMLQSAAAERGPRATIVRFVNVLGSQGSAPETFARQIVEGRPLTITHRDMRRYWITPAHANLLLLHAACVADRVATVTPDAGDEIPAEEIARRVYRALRPDASGPEIAITGLRPGERLSEPLSAAHEHLESFRLPGLHLVRGTLVPHREAVDATVDRLDALLERVTPQTQLREAVFEAVRSLQSAGR